MRVRLSRNIKVRKLRFTFTAAVAEHTIKNQGRSGKIIFRVAIVEHTIKTGQVRRIFVFAAGNSVLPFSRPFG